MIARAAIAAAAAVLQPAPRGVPDPPRAIVETIYDAPLAREPGREFRAVTVTYPPGGASPPHYHTGADIVFAYVLEGRIESQVEGFPLRSYGPGESWVERPGAHHVVARNASRSASATMLAVIVSAPPPADHREAR